MAENLTLSGEHMLVCAVFAIRPFPPGPAVVGVAPVLAVDPGTLNTAAEHVRIHYAGKGNTQTGHRLSVPRSHLRSLPLTGPGAPITAQDMLDQGLELFSKEQKDVLESQGQWSPLQLANMLLGTAVRGALTTELALGEESLHSPLSKKLRRTLGTGEEQQSPRALVQQPPAAAPRPQRMIEPRQPQQEEATLEATLVRT